ncbi:hypothetical protein ACE0DR_02235 [Azotobacter sp. CWF10]
MPSHSISHGNRRFGIILGIGCLLVVSLAGMKMKGGILNDSFHHGEYFASLATLLSSQYTLVPLTIHGALDYIPGLIAFHTFGPEDYFFPTWLIYRLLNVAAAILLYLLAEDFSKDRPHSLFISLAWALCAPAFVGYRDVMLLLSIYLYFSIQKQDNPSLQKCLKYVLESWSPWGCSGLSTEALPQLSHWAAPASSSYSEADCIYHRSPLLPLLSWQSSLYSLRLL